MESLSSHIESAKIANSKFPNSQFQFRPPALLANSKFPDSQFQFRPPALLANSKFPDSQFPLVTACNRLRRAILSMHPLSPPKQPRRDPGRMSVRWDAQRTLGVTLPTLPTLVGPTLDYIVARPTLATHPAGVHRSAGGRNWNWESGNFEFARSPIGGAGTSKVAPPPPPPKRCSPTARRAPRSQQPAASRRQSSPSSSPLRAPVAVSR